tara:strand:+ start:42357 stop:43271 length:915 start_codon:yes stop_codon:yes gene_type:complete
VNSKLKNSDFIYRKLKLTDYYEFNKLFYNCFKRKISFDFFKSRYFNDKFSFCYGAFQSSKLIANVGMFSMKLNNNSHERVFSRHSSMVLKKFRGNGIFSDLLEVVKKKIIKKIHLVAMWPNKNNFANFGIDEKKMIIKKHYLYKVISKTTSLKKTNNFHNNELIKFKGFIEDNKSLYLKNFIYLKKRYLSYKKNEYFINKFVFKKFTSFFILKRNKDNAHFNYVILDHFGSEKIKSKHLFNLIAEQNKLIFLSKKKINKDNLRLIDYLYFKIGFIKKFNLKQKKDLLNKEIYLGDTDIFITTAK